MAYWTIINGVQAGPMSFEELTRVPGFGPDTPVWREGLPDWTTAGELADTAHLFSIHGRQSYVQGNSPSSPGAPAPYQAGYDRQPSYAPGSPLPDMGAPGMMPPTYLVWAVISTLCCCLPTGIVAIIYASKVSPLWQRGDYAGSKNASEKAGWWVIISFVLGFIWAPFSMLWSLLTM
ncbi:MAG: CD225/dispanin family protein [Duncaniella sp.]|nr:CD225/dispanin family protein [Duncaniella sp.]